ncbi:hypothetical protein BGZ65_007554 [Modicella reniformis]|uniref:FAD-binding domain-containing protein n=1 Tax=Modicella reniformis TaxID=1440133 RepID=A0A9P6MK83_9FUNG|nr:hypothetical protein BGZ65_007554 [Modicella reniformis]
MSRETFKPKILIIGCGLAGLSLAAILEHAKIPYELFDKAKELRPLGSAISIGPAVMPMFTQLGIMEQVQAKGKLMTESFLTNEKLELLTHLDFHTEAVERPALQGILLSLIPKHKIHLNKRVLSFCETGEGVMIRTSDNKTHHGNILVGADGPYSSVRQTMYQKMDKEGKLPSVDKKPFKYSTICLVGQTYPLDEATYAHVEDDVCRYEMVICDDRPLCCCTFTTAEKTVCWMVFEILDQESNDKNDNFRSTEWGPEAAESMCNQVRNLRLRENLVLGDLIDKTPKNVICKVMLEEKIFKSWVYGRTVLIGDGNDLHGQVLRKVMHNMPLKLWHLVRDEVSAYRPQISFLPLVEDRGTKGPAKQPSLKKTQV